MSSWDKETRLAWDLFGLLVFSSTTLPGLPVPRLCLCNNSGHMLCDGPQEPVSSFALDFFGRQSVSVLCSMSLWWCLYLGSLIFAVIAVGLSVTWALSCLVLIKAFAADLAPKCQCGKEPLSSEPGTGSHAIGGLVPLGIVVIRLACHWGIIVTLFRSPRFLA